MRPAGFRALAPAKVNLFLHVGAPDPSGYHPLSSLVVFADVGDGLTIAPAASFALEITGPFAGELDAAGAKPGDNLVEKAARAFAVAAGQGSLAARLTLDKRLPIASGVGGGSADAGAALRLLRRALAPMLADQVLAQAAAGLGADGPMCLHARPALAAGYGEVLTPAPVLPVLHAVLVNPRAASPTGAVYRAYDQAVALEGAAAPDLPRALPDLDAVIALLETTRNDLEAPAVALAPAIAQVLNALRAQPQARFVRMSGSGATCFVLCEDAAAAKALAASLTEAHPGWWVQPCRLGGPWPEAEPGVA
jgi:4-diphosphocytidyl-2-C-methyl-D-erythritol kinase